MDGNADTHKSEIRLGSDSWLESSVYNPDDKYTIAKQKFFNCVKWDVLASIASRCRDGARCSYVAKFSAGQCNMVRRLNFDDGISWVVRVRLPANATCVNLQGRDDRRAFEVEVASLKFFRSKSTILVPEVFAYDFDSSNEVGMPYLIMEYIHGTTAIDLAKFKDHGPGLYGTVEQDQKFREQMARVQAEVLSFKFPEIGSLCYSEDTSSFFIGPDIQTGRGPWKSSTEYYRDLTDHLLKNTVSCLNEKNRKETPCLTLPMLLNHLMNLYSEERDGPFRLNNSDFGAHNVLVDDDFNIVGVVDFDGVAAAPLEAAAQYPVFTGLDAELPGIIETEPVALVRMELTKLLLVDYKEWLIQYEAEFGGDRSAPVGNRLGSPAAIVYLAMTMYNTRNSAMNERWLTSALKMLREHTEAQP
ncbi:hypothetical protein F5B20DRAFT_579688 [Whalleya microplaca]|nr:hypothetical protein F5B20DRAFT_579688 [Whalleya microplaca]